MPSGFLGGRDCVVNPWEESQFGRLTPLFKHFLVRTDFVDSFKSFKGSSDLFCPCFQMEVLTEKFHLNSLQIVASVTVLLRPN